MIILVTCFDPFGGGSANSSMLAMELIPDTLDLVSIHKSQLPTAYEAAVERIRGLITDLEPSAIVMLGQAEGRTELSVERIGINWDEAGIADNAGELRTEQPIQADAPDGYFATLPIKAMVEASKEAGIPAAISNSAGTFVCNHILFSTLHMLKMQNKPILAGFIHIPATPAQAAAKRGASMDSRTAADGLIHMLHAVSQKLNTGKKEPPCQNQ